MNTKKALIVVDVQNDFCKNGTLEVKDGDSIVDLINQEMRSKYHLVVATLDWHPQNHKSFASNNNVPLFSMGTLNGQPQRMWPDHCVENTIGSQLHPKLDVSLITDIIKKGTNPEVDSYSGFFDNDKKSETGLNNILLKNNITEVVIVGLALDYCVKATAEDAQRLGYKTTVIVDLTRSVNMSPDDDKKTISDLTAQGVIIRGKL